MQVNNEYRFQGQKGEKVPKSVETMIVNPGIQGLPSGLCEDCRSLREVSLPAGLIMIGHLAFYKCLKLLEISICSTVISIRTEAFNECRSLTKVEFESSPSSSPHQLKRIGGHAFQDCDSLQRIKPPSSVNMIGANAFINCTDLVEADLSTTSITEIRPFGFSRCYSLQTVSLPNSLELIGKSAFELCTHLVTVTLSKRPIEIGVKSFRCCRALANLVLPKGSTCEKDSFGGCALLRKRFGKGEAHIVAGLVSRFDKFPVHGLCYDHSSTSAQQLRLRAHRGAKRKIEELLVDKFKMTPFHVLCSAAEPSKELLRVLLDQYPYYVLDWKDAKGKLAVDYLVINWSSGNKMLLQMALQSWMISRLERWGATSWMEVMKNKVQDILAEDNKEQRLTLWKEFRSAFATYETMAAPSVLEMALWKMKIEYESSNNGGQLPDREEGRYFCGSAVLIPNVLQFLDIVGSDAISIESD